MTTVFGLVESCTNTCTSASTSASSSASTITGARTDASTIISTSTCTDASVSTCTDGNGFPVECQGWGRGRRVVGGGVGGGRRMAGRQAGRQAGMRGLGRLLSHSPLAQRSEHTRCGRPSRLTWPTPAPARLPYGPQPSPTLTSASAALSGTICTRNVFFMCSEVVGVSGATQE